MILFSWRGICIGRAGKVLTLNYGRNIKEA